MLHLASATHPRAYSLSPWAPSTATCSARNSLSYARGCGATLLFASSVEVYGENRGDAERFAEGDRGYLDCNTVRAGYNEAKRLGEAMCQAWRAQEQGGASPASRASTGLLFALRPRLSRSSSQRAIAGEDVVLKSDGTQRYSYLHVADATSGLLHVLLKGKTARPTTWPTRARTRRCATWRSSSPTRAGSISCSTCRMYRSRRLLQGHAGADGRVESQDATWLEAQTHARIRYSRNAWYPPRGGFASMQDYPLISVIVPVYNVEAYVRECVESLVVQEYPNWRSWSWTTGATDSSGTICDDLSAAHENVTCLHSRRTADSPMRVTTGWPEATASGYHSWIPTTTFCRYSSVL